MTPARPLILIVDDSEKNRKLARDVLGAAGVRTLEAASGADAIALASEHLPDVILLDLQLPDLDGTEVARELRNAARTAHIRIVALSASPYVASTDFNGYLRKPIDIKAFPDQVRSYCGLDRKVC